MNGKHIAILGAGPIGLEAAVAAAREGLPFTLYESGALVAGNVRAWGHVRLFTPWSMNVSPRVRALLAEHGREPPGDDTCPTGHDLVERVFGPLSEVPDIASRLRLDAEVVEVGREGLLKSDEIGTGRRADRPFRLLVRDADGAESLEYADVVLDCTGTYHNPNALGSGGIRAPGERDAAEYITRDIPDVEGSDVQASGSWSGQRILLVGAGHSAQTAARDLERLVERAPETRVVWAIRSESPTFGSLEDDPLPARAALVQNALRLVSAASPFDVRLGRSVEALEPSADAVSVTLRRPDGETELVTVDRIVSLTGSVGDASIYRQLQVHECYATSGPMKLAAALLSSSSTDCLTQESHGADTLRNPEPDFYILGSKSYGRNTTFLLRVGWEQVDEVFTLLGAATVGAGDSR